MKSVRFVSSSVALAYDSKHDKIVKVSRAVDDKGRQWEQYDDGEYVQIDRPEEPQD